MGSFEVVLPGLLTSVQDLGRPGFAALGVPEGGAADTLSLRAANRLVGNADNAAALEFTLLGGSFRFESDALIALGAGESQARIERSDGPARVVPPWTAAKIRAGETLVVGPLGLGARGYLCVGGGLSVSNQLSSASTQLSAGFGGYLGRALRAGDRLEFMHPPLGFAARPIGSSAVGFLRESITRRALRALDGPHAQLFGREAALSFWTSEFSVSAHSNRIGVRLEGPVVESPGGGRLPSEGMPRGAVQIPENGQPIILGAEHPTTGGYPAIACLASVDHAALGQVRPGDRVRFRRISLADALRQHREHEARLDAEVPPP